jgi:hypothetical protein
MSKTLRRELVVGGIDFAVIALLLPRRADCYNSLNPGQTWGTSQ